MVETIETTRFRSQRPYHDAKGKLQHQDVTVTWYRVSDGEKATPWSPLALKSDERSGNSRPSAQKLWERGSTFALPARGRF